MPTQNRAVLVRRAMAYARRKSPRTVEFAPAGDAQLTSTGVGIVYLQQLHGGIPVFRALRSVRFSAKGAIVEFTGRWLRIGATVPTAPKITALAAARVAALHKTVSGGNARQRNLEVIAQIAGSAQPTVLRSDDSPAVTASLTVCVLPRRTTLAWQVRMNVRGASDVYALFVDATSARPRVIDAIPMHSRAVSGLVYEFDPASRARQSVAFPLPRTAYPVFQNGRIPIPEWTTGNETVGNNVRSLDSGRRPAIGTNGPNGLTFSGGADNQPSQWCLNAFYLCNLLHDFFLLLGFDEASGNFQARNAITTGGQNDPLIVIMEPRHDPRVASFSNSADGTSCTLTLRSFGGRHASLDAGVVIHEYAHGVVDHLIGGPNNAMPLIDPQSIALGEGYSDYFALTVENYYRRRVPGVAEVFVFGKWVAPTATGLRALAYGPGFHATYGQIGKGVLKDNENAGQVWCAALMEINRVLANGGSQNAGDELGWQLVLDSVRLLHDQPLGLTFLDGRNKLLDAFDTAVSLNRIANGPAVRVAILAVFKRFGMGPKARSKDAGYRNITEDK